MGSKSSAIGLFCLVRTIKFLTPWLCRSLKHWWPPAFSGLLRTEREPWVQHRTFRNVVPQPCGNYKDPVCSYRKSQLYYLGNTALSLQKAWNSRIVNLEGHSHTTSATISVPLNQSSVFTAVQGCLGFAAPKPPKMPATTRSFPGGWCFHRLGYTSVLEPAFPCTFPKGTEKVPKWDCPGILR